MWSRLKIRVAFVISGELFKDIDVLRRLDEKERVFTLAQSQELFQEI